MKLSSQVSLPEFFGALGVVASLIFVGLELRHANFLAESASVSEINNQFNELNLLVVQQPGFAELLYQYDSDPSTVSSAMRQQIMFWAISWFNVYDAAWKSHQLGIIDNESFGSYTASACSTIPSLPHLRDFWDEVKYAFTPGFVEYVDRQCPKHDSYKAFSQP